MMLLLVVQLVGMQEVLSVVQLVGMVEVLSVELLAKTQGRQKTLLWGLIRSTLPQQMPVRVIPRLRMWGLQLEPGMRWREERFRLMAPRARSP
jgi:hypothetical protein